MFKTIRKLVALVRVKPSRVKEINKRLAELKTQIDELFPAHQTLWGAVDEGDESARADAELLGDRIDELLAETTELRAELLKMTGSRGATC